MDEKPQGIKENDGKSAGILTEDGKLIVPETEAEKKARIGAEKAKLDAALARGDIDGVKYNQRLIELMVPDKYDAKPKPGSGRAGKIAALIAVLIAIGIAAIPGAIYVNWRFYFQNTLTAKGVTDYYSRTSSAITKDPVQVAVSGLESGEYKNREIGVEYKYYYDISGVITSVHDYWGFDDYATLVPRDVCLAWGSLADVYAAGGAEFYQYDRFCYGKITDAGADVSPSEMFTYRTAWGQTRTSTSSMSNNHLIPSTAEIRNQIQGLRAGEKVRIVGYLVTVQYGEMQLSSSTTREDAGNGACEVIYVTHVDKIEE